MSEELALWNQILQLAEEYGSFEPDDNGDSFEDLDEEERQDKWNVLVELLKRPKRIGRI